MVRFALLCSALLCSILISSLLFNVAVVIITVDVTVAVLADQAKARLQAHYGTSLQIPYRGPIDVLTRTFRTEGITGLYRGFGAILLGGTPGTMVYLCSYDIIKDRLSSLNTRDDTDFVVHFAAGMLAETLACIIYVPVDVIKERLQVQHSSTSNSGSSTHTNINNPNYRNSMDALRQIAKNEGLSGIYRGYGATLASFGPFSALYFVVYERLKRFSRKPNDDHDLPFSSIVLCSCTAGAFASWLTSPLDMAKLRLQVQRGNVASEPTMVVYRGMVDCLATAYRHGGVAALFRGAGARVLHFAPGTTITMTCYETFRSFFAKTLSS
jgi:hypothetical protein